MSAHRKAPANSRPIAEPKYHSTIFDREGPDAVHTVRTWSYGLMVFGVTVGVQFALVGFAWFVLPVGIVAALMVVGLTTFISNLAGNSYKHLMVNGASTPYIEQYSYQQTLVMKGELDEALASFEAVIADDAHTATARLKAAELYSREKKNHLRAAELFREVQRLPAVSTGDYVYATNRLVDLLVGPLNEPGKARMELRKLMDKLPDSPAAANARLALTELISRETRE